jgi:hypothetical protein
VQEGKLFIWPTIALGFRRKLLDVVIPGLTKPVEMQTISHTPRLFALSNLMTSVEASELMEVAVSDKGKEEGDVLQRSTVGSGENKATSSHRTGMTAWEADSELAISLQTRVLHVLRAAQSQQQEQEPLHIDATWIEDVQILKYEEGEMYSFHYG